MSSPSQRAVNAAAPLVEAIADGAIRDEQTARAEAREVLDAAHSAALGDDRSIRLGDVLDLLTSEEAHDHLYGEANAASLAAEWLRWKLGGTDGAR